MSDFITKWPSTNTQTLIEFWTSANTTYHYCTKITSVSFCEDVKDTTKFTLWFWYTTICQWVNTECMHLSTVAAGLLCSALCKFQHTIITLLVLGVRDSTGRPHGSLVADHRAWLMVIASRGRTRLEPGHRSCIMLVTFSLVPRSQVPHGAVLSPLVQQCRLAQGGGARVAVGPKSWIGVVLLLAVQRVVWGVPGGGHVTLCRNPEIGC